jgi:hypothetical protein
LTAKGVPETMNIKAFHFVESPLTKMFRFAEITVSKDKHRASSFCDKKTVQIKNKKSAIRLVNSQFSQIKHSNYSPDLIRLFIPSFEHFINGQFSRAVKQKEKSGGNHHQRGKHPAKSIVEMSDKDCRDEIYNKRYRGKTYPRSEQNHNSANKLRVD